MAQKRKKKSGQEFTGVKKHQAQDKRRKRALQFTVGFAESISETMSKKYFGQVSSIKPKLHSKFIEALENLPSEKMKKEILGENLNDYLEVFNEELEKSWPHLSSGAQEEHIKAEKQEGKAEEKGSQDATSAKNMPRSIQNWQICLQKDAPRHMSRSLKEIWGVLEALKIAAKADLPQLITSLTSSVGGMTISWPNKPPAQRHAAEALGLVKSFVAQLAMKDRSRVAEPFAVYTSLMILVTQTCPSAASGHLSSTLKPNFQGNTEDQSSSDSSDEEIDEIAPDACNGEVLKHLLVLSAVLLDDQEKLLIFLEKVVYTCLQIHGSALDGDGAGVLANLLSTVLCKRIKELSSYEEIPDYLRFLGVLSESFKLWKAKDMKLWNSCLYRLNQVKIPKDFCRTVEECYLGEEATELESLLQCHRTTSSESLRNLFDGSLHVSGPFIKSCAEQVVTNLHNESLSLNPSVSLEQHTEKSAFSGEYSSNPPDIDKAEAEGSERSDKESSEGEEDSEQEMFIIDTKGTDQIK